MASEAAENPHAGCRGLIQTAELRMHTLLDAIPNI